MGIPSPDREVTGRINQKKKRKKEVVCGGVEGGAGLGATQLPEALVAKGMISLVTA